MKYILLDRSKLADSCTYTWGWTPPLNQSLRSTLDWMLFSEEPWQVSASTPPHTQVMASVSLTAPHKSWLVSASTAPIKCHMLSCACVDWQVRMLSVFLPQEGWADNIQRKHKSLQFSQYDKSISKTEYHGIQWYNATQTQWHSQELIKVFKQYIYVAHKFIKQTNITRHNNLLRSIRNKTKMFFESLPSPSTSL